MLGADYQILDQREFEMHIGAMMRQLVYNKNQFIKTDTENEDSPNGPLNPFDEIEKSNQTPDTCSGM